MLIMSRLLLRIASASLFQAAPSASDVLALCICRRAVEDFVGGAVVGQEDIDGALLAVPAFSQDISVVDRASRHLCVLNAVWR